MFESWFLNEIRIIDISSALVGKLVFLSNEAHCCGASVASEQQHEQDLRRNTKAQTHHFLPECIAFNHSALRYFNQSALRRVQLEDAPMISGCGVCSDLLENRCEGDCT